MNILRFLIKFLLGICFLILIILTLQYLVTPKYTYPEPGVFAGDYIFNPYRNIDPAKWRMANFHAHTRKIFDKTKSASKSNILLDSTYKSFDYDITSISDYEYINLYESKNKWFIPVYEHGYQYYKNHQLVLNAKKVSWLDFPFRQTLDNKQFIINRLKKNTSTLITIVHPFYRKAYSLNDFKYLTNYDCLEIANSKRLFTSYYDAALSYGHPIFLMADDDSHDLNNIEDVCSSFNLINTDMVRDSILNSLRTGRSIGVKFNLSSFKTNEEKRAGLLKLPEVKSITFKSDTLAVSLNMSVNSIKFIGQDGIEKKKMVNCLTGSYFFSNEDTYIRTEIECNDGTIFFLNPLFRYDGIKLTEYAPSYNALKTWTWRSAVICILILTLIIWYRKK
ncbi:MAG TPA: hypothetical protein VF346_07720 [Bacteroidales bacterium]